MTISGCNVKRFVLQTLNSDEHGFTPLHWAGTAGYMNLVELLLVKGARMDITNMGGDTPLHSAVQHGHHDVVAKVCPCNNCGMCSIVVGTCLIDVTSTASYQRCQ